MDRDNLILEIGTEEIPSRFMEAALSSLACYAKEEFKAKRINYDSIETFGTPRRLVLSVRGVAKMQEDLVESFRGPAWGNAFDGNGNPTRAALGFAKSKNVVVEDLEKKEVKGVPYVFAVVSEKGTDSFTLLSDMMCKIIDKLVFPKNMYWKNPTVRFARPVRWFLCLLGDKVVPFEMNGIASGNISRGHRFMGASAVTIPADSDYMEKLFDNYVIVDQAKRKEKMLSAISVLEKEMGGVVDVDPELVVENLYLVEYPIPFYGCFDKKYLEMPEEVLITTMKHHQKYFPVRDETGKLMPYFVGVSNNRAVNMDTIKEGNERVLRARLEDASFFWKEDRKFPLGSKVEKLKDIVYQEKLGSVYDKLMVTSVIAGELCDIAGMNEIRTLVERAALLSKADLVTSMVYEFAELQGVMGREYAKLDGEDPRVALGIYEQYLPRFAGDDLPSDYVGAVIGISERVYNMAGAFKMGFRPSGSQDPYGLRRAVRCINEIIWGKEMDIDMEAFVTASAAKLELEDESLIVLLAFMRQRLLIQLKERGYSHDLAELAISVTGNRPLQALRYLKALEQVRQEEWFEKLVIAAVRVHNILAKAETKETYSIKEDLLKEEEEKNLYKEVTSVESVVVECIEKHEWDRLMAELSRLSPAITAFFDDVMVMDEDLEVRKNRIGLLQRCQEFFKEIGDLSRLKG